MSLVKKILVANRGEIACRIMRTAKRMGVETVAIYSDIDRNSKFVDLADKAYRVGPNPSIESYLNSSKILEIASESQCEALHPGFGFLSENAGFAEECHQNKIIFIGPPSSAITSMGSKSESKKIMTNANVPVVPGYHGENQDEKFLYEQAQRIGYPVLIKAVLGGGGKGMRIVTKKQDFSSALQSCKRQSLKAFKDDRVLIEKYITKPRHIEVQIFGDQFGNYVHLYERDCSIQRRHQKVVEEAPSNISDIIRNSVCGSAINAARAVGYYNAGTVQFIFDLDSNKHYFMEMNTRLQVEHPISEMITGYDFVQWQLKVASGFPLPKKQQQINKKGHAIEVRIYSEDPFNNFLPGNGKLKYFKEPVESEGTRIQTDVREHDTISTFYDPMIAKLITYGKDRPEAIEFMRKALTNYRVVGLPTNLKFLKRVINEPVFNQGDYDTGYIDQNMATLLQKTSSVDSFSLLSAIIARTHHHNSQINLPSELFNFRTVKKRVKHHNLSIFDTSIDKEIKMNIPVQWVDSQRGQAEIQGKKFTFQFSKVKKNVLNIIINGQVRKVEYFIEGESVHLFDGVGDSINVVFECQKMKEVQRDETAEKKLKSPMPGTISKLFVKVGDKIKKGDPIFAMQAMKMQHVIKASFDAKVKKIHIKENDFVEANKQMVELQ